MKNIQVSSSIQKAFFTFCLLAISTLATAQIDVDIDLGKKEWYEDPKIWIGVAIFLVILAFIARSKK